MAGMPGRDFSLRVSFVAFLLQFSLPKQSVNMNPLYLKALHIIFVVTWFAGLFYLVRLFIYHTEANERPEPERSILQKQFNLMQRRLWHIITAPSMVLTLASGLYLAYVLGYFTQPWMLVKLGMVVGLLVYHFTCRWLMVQLEQGVHPFSSTRLRIFNEVATLFLVGIVFLVVLKQTLSMLWGLLGLVLLGVLLMLGIRVYKRLRQRQEN